MRIILLIILLTINALPNTSFAASCLMRGEWMPMMLTPPTKGTLTTKATLGAFLFEQEGNRIWIAPTTDPTCGEIRQEGTSDGYMVSIQMHMTNTENKICRIWTQADATFSADCNHLQGNIVVHMPDADPFEMPFKWTRNLIQITNPNPTQELVISAEPKMPEVNIEAIHKQPDPLAYLSSMGKLNTRTPAYTWHVAIAHDMIPGRVSFKTYMDDVYTDLPTYKPDFNRLKYLDKDTNEIMVVEGGIMGGELTLSVEYYNAIKDEQKYTIKGTNPGRIAIDQMLTDTVTRQIACQESRYLQFHATREGGVGFPEVGQLQDGSRKGGVGIMQLYIPEPTPQQTWNWRENIKGGLTLIEIKRMEARNLPRTELGRLNEERKTLGLPLCKSLPELSEKELVRETLRRYNSGREHQWEPRDNLDCSGQWVVKPHLLPKADKNYVEKVLACKL